MIECCPNTWNRKRGRHTTSNLQHKARQPGRHLVRPSGWLLTLSGAEEGIKRFC